MPIIRQMDQRLANMIAAGEVVDRPASVIKELMENAIDAHATQVSVEIFDMGMKKMIVKDNGVGMDHIDAKMAFSRHATSKIKDEFDLSHIHTLGFRGEALAAIASVSKVLLKTRQEQGEGIYVRFEGGHFVSEGPATLNQGTVVEVSDLFFNTPARFKYIKSDVAEKMQITDVFDRIALANPHIRFTLSMDDKTIKETYGNGDFYQLIDHIYGARMTKGMIIFHETVQKMKIDGYLLSPSIARSRKKDISIFVNGRYIKNYALIQAVIEGYHTFMMVGKYPIALIHIAIDPSLLDVNVHPQKYEIKFVNEMILAYHIESFVKRALLMEKHDIVEAKDVLDKKFETESYTPIQFEFHEMVEQTIPIEDEKTRTHRLPDMEYVGVFSGTYLIFQNEEGMFLVDQHAAAERVRYEHYVHALAHPNNAQKIMLIERPLDLTDQDRIMIQAHLKSLNDLGFRFTHDLHVTDIPTWLRDEEIELALETCLTMLEESHQINRYKLRDTLAKDISCKGAIKANQALSHREVEALMKHLQVCENPYHCPHGRPTIVKLSHYDIERMFKRVV